MNGVNKESATFFKPRYQMNFHISEGFTNSTENGILAPKPENPYNNDIIAVYNSIDPFHPESGHMWRYIIGLDLLVIIGSGVYWRLCRPKRRTRRRNKPESIAMSGLAGTPMTTF